MKKVNKLSDKDIALFPKIVDKWIDIGLNTAESNKKIAEKAVVDAYKVVNLDPPKEIKWFQSPYAAAKYIKNELGISAPLSGVLYGQFEAVWMSFYDFFNECESVKIEDIEKVHPLMQISKECSWWWPFDQMAILTEHPAEIHRDAAGRLHAENGKSIRFRDDWGLYSWHGYTIPRTHEWIFTNRSKLNPTIIEKESNAELRRIMLEIYGFANYLGERKAKLISEDLDGAGNPRRLIEIDVAGVPTRIVEVVNSSPEPDGTRRKFHLGAMRGDTPHDVIAASFGFNPDKFKEEAAS